MIKWKRMPAYAAAPPITRCRKKILASKTLFSGTLGDASPYTSEDVSANLMQWSTDGSTGYDLQTISLHELGHFAGLDDLYFSSASDEVMYSYCNGADGDPYIGDKAGIPTSRFSRFNINISNTPNRSSIDLPYPRRQLLS